MDVEVILATTATASCSETSELTDAAMEISSCLICTDKVSAIVPNSDTDVPLKSDPKELLSVFCKCAAVELSDLKVTSENAIAFCTTCSAYLKEWSVLQEDISKLILRSSQVKATLLSRLLEPGSEEGQDVKSSDEINELNQKSQVTSQLRALISKQFSVKVRLCDLTQGFQRQSGCVDVEESGSISADEVIPDSDKVSSCPIVIIPLKQEQDLIEDCVVLDEDDQSFTSESITSVGDLEWIGHVGPGSSHGRKRRGRPVKQLRPKPIPQQPAGSRVTETLMESIVTKLKLESDRFQSKDNQNPQPGLAAASVQPVVVSASDTTKSKKKAGERRRKLKVHKWSPVKGIKIKKKIKSGEIQRDAVPERCSFKGFDFISTDRRYVCCTCLRPCFRKSGMEQHIKEEHLGLPKEPASSQVTVTLTFNNKAVKHVGGEKYLYKNKLPFTFTDGKFTCGVCGAVFRGFLSSAQKRTVQHLKTEHQALLSASWYSPGLEFLSEPKKRGRKRSRVDLNEMSVPITSNPNFECDPLLDMVQVKLECPEVNEEITVKPEPMDYYENNSSEFNFTPCEYNVPSSIFSTHDPVSVPIATPADLTISPESSESLIDLQPVPSLVPLPGLDCEASTSLLEQTTRDDSLATIVPDVSIVKTESTEDTDRLL